MELYVPHPHPHGHPTPHTLPSTSLSALTIIIIKRISRAPIYHTRWQHRALYNNTNTRTHARTHARTSYRRQLGVEWSNNIRSFCLTGRILPALESWPHALACLINTRKRKVGLLFSFFSFFFFRSSFSHFSVRVRGSSPR